MASVAENLRPEQIRYRKPINQSISPASSSSSSLDLTPQISPLLQSTRCKPTISSLFISTFSTHNNSSNNNSNMDPSNISSSVLKNKKKNNSTFRGFGCTSSSEVSAPTIIRSSSDWQQKRDRKKKQKKQNHNQMVQTSNNNPTPVVVVPDVWCAPGIAFSSDSAASVDCVVSRRPVQGRGRMEERGDRVNHRERSSISRRVPNPEPVSIFDSPSTIESARIGSDVFGARHHRHFRHRSPGVFDEIMMFQNSILLGGSSDDYDRHREMRLNVDNMSYEELLELGDRIGHVNTGLREDEIFHCLRKTKNSVLDSYQPHFLSEENWKCSICQEEYEAEDEVGKLDCGHTYHICCIKQWLLQKNACPVCKVAAMVQY